MRFNRVNQFAANTPWFRRGGGEAESARGLAHSKSSGHFHRGLHSGGAFGVRQSGAFHRGVAAFTLAEVLAALAFMAIVIPVAVNGLRVANLAGQVGQRKAVAARIAERALNEYTATSQTQTPAQSGTVREGAEQYRWSIRTTTWNQDAMRLVTVQVFYPVQGQEYEVHASTLMGNSTR